MNSKRTKLLFTIPNFDTAGSGKVVYDLATGIDRSRFEVEIALSHDRGEYFKVVERAGLKIHIVNTTTNYKPYWSLLFRLKSHIKFLRKNKFDIVHSWHWSSDWTEPLACRLAGVRFVYTKKAMSWGNRHWIFRSRLSSHIVIINNDMREQFFKGWNNVSKIPIGIDLDYYAPLPRSRVVTRAISYDADDFVIVSVANLVPIKGIELIVEAVARIKNARIKYLVVGNNENDYGKQLMAKVADMGMAEQIKFVGKVLDVRPYLTVSDVFAIPTLNEGRKEGMPMAPVEAMACQRIVLGSRISGITDIMTGFEDFIFKPANVNDIVKKIEFVLAMSLEERALWSKKMRHKVALEYGIGKFIHAHEDLYDSLLGK